MSNVIRLPRRPRLHVMNSDTQSPFVRPDVEPVEPVEDVNAEREDWIHMCLPPVHVTVGISAILAAALVVALSVSLWGRL